MPGPRPYRVSKRMQALDTIREKIGVLAGQLDGVVLELQKPEADDPALAKKALAEAKKLQKKLAACMA